MKEPSLTAAARAARFGLTPEISKRARRELGLSQIDVIKATGIQGYKLKQWEGRGLTIELADIRKLSEFYESQGIDIAELIDHISRSNGAGREGGASQAAEARPALQDGFTYTPRPGFLITDSLPPDLVDKLMAQMEANDERIAALTIEAFDTGIFGGLTEETEGKARELLGALAENHVLFRALQGRNIVGPIRDEPKTVGDYLAHLMKASPVMPLLAQPIEARRATATADAEE